MDNTLNEKNTPNDLCEFYDQLTNKYGIENDLKVEVPKPVVPVKEEYTPEPAVITVEIPDEEVEKPLSEVIKEETKEIEPPVSIDSISTNKQDGILVIDGFSEVKPFQFADNEGIKYVAISDSVKKIGAYAFINCKNIEAAALYCDTKMLSDTTLKAIFKGCSKLKEIWINGFIIKVDL